MSNENPFPESPEKAYLRRLHLKYLADYKKRVGQDIAYFGLPSAQMLDVKVWKPVLGHITAVERDKNLVLLMLRTAQLIGVREKTLIIEKDLKEASGLLAMKDRDAELAILQLSLPERQVIQKARSIPYDVINMDMCGGFLHPRKDGTSDNVETLKSLIDYQARYKHPFTLILTFNLRDTGRKAYENFIVDSLDQLDKYFEINASEVKDWYASGRDKQQPANLRKLRFCVPVYLHNIAFKEFQVKSLGAWYYKKHFYHTALFFEPRQGTSILGMMWPPIDEFKEILRAPMHSVAAGTKDNNIELQELPAPIIE